MKSLTTLTNLYTSLAQNATTANVSLGQQLISDQHRYLIIKFFDNERSYQTTTVGSMTLAFTGGLALGATTATLTVAWAYPTGTQLCNFSNGDQRTVLFTNGSATVAWPIGLTKTATTSLLTDGFQAYTIPANISKIKNSTITIGQLRFVPAPIMTRGEWDLINFLPYNSDIPNYYYIYNDQVLFWPIPSTTGNVIQFNYQCRVPDLSFADYTSATLATMAAGSTTVTGTGTTWSTEFPLNTDVTIFNLGIRADPSTGGDGIWYPISTFQSDTQLTLVTPVQNAPNITTATTYTIGQLPLLQEDFQDMLVFGALKVYFSSVNLDVNQFKLFDSMYGERYKLLEDYAGTKQVNVDLGAQPQFSNPNLYPYAVPGQ